MLMHASLFLYRHLSMLLLETVTLVIDTPFTCKQNFLIKGTVNLAFLMFTWPIAQPCFHHNSNSLEMVMTCQDSNVDRHEVGHPNVGQTHIGVWVGFHIATKVSTYHDSTAVVPCAKFHNDFTLSWTIHAKGKLHFLLIWIILEIWLVN